LQKGDSSYAHNSKGCLGSFDCWYRLPAPNLKKMYAWVSQVTYFNLHHYSGLDLMTFSKTHGQCKQGQVVLQSLMKFEMYKCNHSVLLLHAEEQNAMMSTVRKELGCRAVADHTAGESM